LINLDKLLAIIYISSFFKRTQLFSNTSIIQEREKLRTSPFCGCELREVDVAKGDAKQAAPDRQLPDICH